MQELRLATLLGDADAGGLSSTAISLMVACGQKSDKTDFMSVLAKELDISRDVAKVSAYGSLYGQGLSGETTLLMKNIPGITNEAATAKAREFINKFKGRKDGDRYTGGLASAFFNAVGARLRAPSMASPILGASLSKPIFAARDDYAPTVLNWNVQTSGVDCRDITVAVINYLFHRFDIDGRLLLTIHDEIRTLVAEKDAPMAVYCLQLAHLVVWAYVSDVLGICAIPASGAWASGVDVDSVLRKEPTDPCVTPTQTALPLGEVWNIEQTLAAIAPYRAMLSK